jgi:hypothetical protein
MTLRYCGDRAPRVLATYEYNGCTRLGRGIKVSIGLRGKGWDPACVFWDSYGNSFCLVYPPDNAPKELVSDQGVMLLSINGIGEIRWDVDYALCERPENIEAVRHFGLTYSYPYSNGDGPNRGVVATDK